MPRTNHGGIPCPTCAGDSSVIDSRVQTLEDGSATIRRRRCCKKKPVLHRFTTVEIVAPDGSQGNAILTRKARSILRDRLERLIREELSDVPPNQQNSAGGSDG